MGVVWNGAENIKVYCLHSSESSAMAALAKYNQPTIYDHINKAIK